MRYCTLRVLSWLGDFLRNRIPESDETCPKAPDEREVHCRCWYDGDVCHYCGHWTMLGLFVYRLDELMLWMDPTGDITRGEV